jgi:hypothetical protein
MIVTSPPVFFSLNPPPTALLVPLLQLTLIVFFEFEFELLIALLRS